MFCFSSLKAHLTINIYKREKCQQAYVQTYLLLSFICFIYEHFCIACFFFCCILLYFFCFVHTNTYVHMYSHPHPTTLANTLMPDIIEKTHTFYFPGFCSKSEIPRSQLHFNGCCHKSICTAKYIYNKRPKKV